VRMFEQALKLANALSVDRRSDLVSRLDHVRTKFGDKPLREIDRVEFQDWLNQLAREYSRSMVFHCHTFLKSMCSEAVEQDFLAKDLSRKLKRPKTRKPDETILEWPQYQSVIDAAQTLRDKMAIKVGSGTAVRRESCLDFAGAVSNCSRTVATHCVLKRQSTSASSDRGPRPRKVKPTFHCPNGWLQNSSSGEVSRPGQGIRISFFLTAKAAPWITRISRPGRWIRSGSS
jgi:integrase